MLKKNVTVKNSFKCIRLRIPHRGAVGVHVTQLWDGVFGVDGDDDLRPGLVPVETTWRHFLILQRYSTIKKNNKKRWQVFDVNVCIKQAARWRHSGSSHAPCLFSSTDGIP